MLSWIIYACSAIVVGIGLAFVSLVFKGCVSKTQGDPFKAVFMAIAVCMGAPFAYVEVLTKMAGPELGKAVAHAYAQAPVDGPMMYYKVLKFNGKKARCLVVGQEPENWGGTDRPVLKINLTKKGDKWIGDSFEVVESRKLNENGMSFPPYN